MQEIRLRKKKENLSDENVLQILQDVCNAKNEEKIAKLRELLEVMNVKKDSVR